MGGANLEASLGQSIDLRGFMRDGNVTKPEGFRLPDFNIDIANRQATCPAGQVAIRWSAISNRAISSKTDRQDRNHNHVRMSCEKCGSSGGAQSHQPGAAV